jgi:hypothetical protein
MLSGSIFGAMRFSCAADYVMLKGLPRTGEDLTAASLMVDALMCLSVCAQTPDGMFHHGGVQRARQREPRVCGVVRRVSAPLQGRLRAQALGARMRWASGVFAQHGLSFPSAMSFSFARTGKKHDHDEISGPTDEVKGLARRKNKYIDYVCRWPQLAWLFSGHGLQESIGGEC